jgi:hypothetical protein
METIKCVACRCNRTESEFNQQKNGTRAKTCVHCIQIAYERYLRRRGKECLWCGAPTPGTVYCDEHRAIIRDQMRAKRALKPARTCKTCGVEVKAFRNFCATCIRQRNLACQRRWGKERVLRIYAKYGGAKCACCGESTFEFLTLDHINDDGADHRKTIGGSGSHVYSWIVRKNYPEGYQVLCYNCNAGRYRNGGICPHKQLT